MITARRGRFLRAARREPNMNPNFRQRAREALRRAKTEMASGCDERLSYAALELRMAIEAVTYERAKSFEKELPPQEYDVWQPSKLMKVLLELEPLADASGTLSFGLEDEPGVPAKEMRTLGSEKVFNLKDIKESYDALGSFLHQPTLRQLNSGGHNWRKLRSRCASLVAKLEPILESPVFNINFGTFTTFKCMNVECEKPVRKRLPSGQKEVPAPCLECGAEHRVTVGSDGVVTIYPVTQDVPCANKACWHILKLFPHELKEGVNWKCPECGTVCQLGLAVFEAPVP